MLAISINDLSLSYGVVPILEKVSFSLEENDKLGIIGVNGCGKSTLFSLILGEREPDEGDVFIARGKSIFVGCLRNVYPSPFIVSEEGLGHGASHNNYRNIGMSGSYRLEKGLVRFSEMLYGGCVMVVIKNESHHIKACYVIGNHLFAFAATRKSEIYMIEAEFTRQYCLIAHSGARCASALSN